MSELNNTITVSPIEKEVSIVCYLTSKENICNPIKESIKFKKSFNGVVTLEVENKYGEINIGKEDLTKILEFLNTD